MTLEHANELFAQFMKDHAHLVDLADAFGPEPTDLQIVTALSEHFDMPRLDMIERLICVDFVTLRREAMS